MPLATGTRLGPYEILAPLGAGGMGEVYKARDPKLDRLVAIKVLPEHLAKAADALYRFEREARTLAGLNHPNITGLFDVGRDGSTSFAVMELLEGESLRSRLSHGPLPSRKAFDFARQIAAGLAAAHEKGIVHRDLKPDNLWLTKDGRVKILDFGLAKMREGTLLPSDPNQPTRALDSDPRTQEGVVLGTVGYMSPEQIRGHAVDARSDLFALGVVLWEMLTGQRPFQGASAIETLNAILTREPPTLDPTLEVPPAAMRILDHCLQKDPANRFQSAGDLGFALETLTQTSLSQPLATPGVRPGRRVALGWTLAGLACSLVLGALLAWSLRPPPPVPLFHRMTFEAGKVGAARFAKDGRTILYSAWWSGSQPGIYSTRAGSTEARSLDLANSELLAVSPKDEMAVLQSSKRKTDIPYLRPGTLAVGQIAGGSPIVQDREIVAADWSPDGSKLLVVRVAGSHCRLECPAGNVLEQGPWRYLNPRFSPDGRMVAFVRVPLTNADGVVAVLDLTSRKARDLTPRIVSLGGLCWHPGGREVWYSTFSDPGGNLHAVDLKGRGRVVAAVPDDIRIQDMAPDGRVLLIQGVTRKTVLVQRSPQASFREVGRYKWCSTFGLSGDGKAALTFEDPLDPNQPFAYTFLHALDSAGGRPRPLPDANWYAFSPDSQDLLSSTELKRASRVAAAAPDGSPDVSFVGPPGRGIFPLARVGGGLICCEYPEGPGPWLTLRSLQGELVRTLASAPEWKDPVNARFMMDPRHTRIIYGAPGAGFRLLSLTEGSQPLPVPFLQKDEEPVQWSRDGNRLFLATEGMPPLVISALDLRNGQRTVLRTVTPFEVTQEEVERLFLDRSGDALAIDLIRERTGLYVVDGFR